MSSEAHTGVGSHDLFAFMVRSSMIQSQSQFCTGLYLQAAILLVFGLGVTIRGGAPMFQRGGAAWDGPNTPSGGTPTIRNLSSKSLSAALRAHRDTPRMRVYR